MTLLSKFPNNGSVSKPHRTLNYPHPHIHINGNGPGRELAKFAARNPPWCIGGEFVRMLVLTPHYHSYRQEINVSLKFKYVEHKKLITNYYRCRRSKYKQQ